MSAIRPRALSTSSSSFSVKQRAAFRATNGAETDEDESVDDTASQAESTATVVANERSSLLPRSKAELAPVTPSYKAEFVSLWCLTLPMWITYLMEFAISGITVVVTGHLGTTELNAASIGQLLINTTTIAPMIFGLTAALDTLATQAYTSSNPKTTSLYVQRTAVLIAASLVPCMVLLSFSEHILLLLRQDPEVARLAGQYVKVFMIGIPFLAGFELLRRWLLAQGLVNVPTYALIIAVPICIVLNYLLVLGPASVRIGFLGAPLASVITEVLMFAALVIFVVFHAPREAHGGFTIAAFQDLGPNIRLGVAGIITVCSEWLAWDVVSLAASYLGQNSFAANQIAVMISVTLFQLPYAMTIAAGIRIGNLLGAQLASQAKIASRVVCISGLLMGVFNSSIMLLSRNKVGFVFSEDLAVIELLKEIIPLIAIFQIGDDLTGATQGVLRGAGLANLAARANIAAYYFFGVPIGFALAFKAGWGLRGLWTGHIFALCLNATINSVFVLKVNWRRQSRKAREQSDATEAFLQERRVIDAAHVAA